MSGDFDRDRWTDDALTAAFSSIATTVRPGAQLSRHWRLTGGVSANVVGLEIEWENQQERWVVRSHCDHHWKPIADDVTETEFNVLRALHRAGVPVPHPLHLDTSTRLLPTPFFVMPMVAGVTTITDAFLDTALRRMAAFLAQLHGLDVHRLALPQLPQREDPVAGVLAYLPAGDGWTRVRAVVASHCVQPVPPRLLHGDFWPGNMIWAEGELAAVVDWEDAALGPAASDVACCRAELAVMFDEAASESFTQYYRQCSTAALADLALWDSFVSSAALASMHAWGLAPEVEARRRKRTRAFLTRAAETLLRSSPSSDREAW